MRRLIYALCAIWLASQCAADMYPLDTSYLRDGKHVEDSGTAVCIARTDRGSLLVTAGHAVEGNPASVWISDRRQWIQATNVQRHPTADLATLEVPVALEVTPLGDSTPVGDAVQVQGYGPRLNGSGESLTFFAHVTAADSLRGDNGEHAIPGDSGGPVIYETESGPVLVGVVTHHEGDVPATRRTQLARHRASTLFVPATTIVTFVQSQYGGCPRGVCPIRVRPQIQQPMVGIGIPIGPPRIVNTIEPAPRPQVICEQLTGPAGPPGPAGRSVTREDVESAVNAWLSSNAEQLRGESATEQQIAAAVNNWLSTHANQVRGPAGADGKPWTVDLVVRWEGQREPIARLAIDPPQHGGRKMVDVPLRKVQLKP